MPGGGDGCRPPGIANCSFSAGTPALGMTALGPISDVLGELFGALRIIEPRRRKLYRQQFRRP
jgi:hypothetical protein